MNNGLELFIGCSLRQNQRHVSPNGGKSRQGMQLRNMLSIHLASQANLVRRQSESLAATVDRRSRDSIPMCPTVSVPQRIFPAAPLANPGRSSDVTLTGRSASSSFKTDSMMPRTFSKIRAADHAPTVAVPGFFQRSRSRSRSRFQIVLLRRCRPFIMSDRFQ